MKFSSCERFKIKNKNFILKANLKNLTNITKANNNKNIFLILLLSIFINQIQTCDIWKASDCKGQPTTAEGLFYI